MGHDIPQSHSTPRVIQDAIEVGKCLGCSFLWVDRICIDPTNAAEKHMGIIYQRAEMTMASLCGDSDQSGLPAVGDVLQTTRPASITSMRSIWTQPCPLSHITWNGQNGRPEAGHIKKPYSLIDACSSRILRLTSHVKQATIAKQSKESWM